MALDLDALEAICAAATPGPWERASHVYESEDAPLELIEDGQGQVICTAGREVADLDFSCDPQANAAFIVAARSVLPELLAEVRKLRELNERQYQECRQLNNELLVERLQAIAEAPGRQANGARLAPAPRSPTGQTPSPLEPSVAPDDALDLDLLAKLARGDGGRRTGALKRAGLVTWTVTEAGRQALEAATATPSPTRSEDEKPWEPEPEEP